MIKNINLIIKKLCLQKQIEEYSIELQTNTAQHNLVFCLKGENPILIRQDVTGNINCIQHQPIDIKFLDMSFFISCTKDNNINL